MATEKPDKSEICVEYTEPVKIETVKESKNPKTEVRFMEYEECKRKRKWFEDEQPSDKKKNGDTFRDKNTYMEGNEPCGDKYETKDMFGGKGPCRTIEEYESLINKGQSEDKFGGSRPCRHTEEYESLIDKEQSGYKFGGSRSCRATEEYETWGKTETDKGKSGDIFDGCRPCKPTEEYETWGNKKQTGDILGDCRPTEEYEPQIDKKQTEGNIFGRRRVCWPTEEYEQIDKEQTGNISGYTYTGPERSGNGNVAESLMSPPPYNDLGKNARDVFNKGYHFGLLKLDCKTKTKSGVEFSSGGVSNIDSGRVFGSLETKYKVSDYGLTFSEKWNTDNTLATEISIQDQITKGLKLSFDSSFAPQTGSKTGRIKSEFRNDACALNCDVDLDMAGPVLLASAVFGYNGWLAGYQTRFDSQKSKITKNNFALGFSSGDFILHTNVNDGQEFGGSIYQKVSPKLDTAIDLNWTAGSNETRFGIGCKYELDQDASVRAKVNNLSQVGLGYQQKLRDGVSVYLSALIDGKNFNQGGHKLGVALELEA